MGWKIKAAICLLLPLAASADPIADRLDAIDQRLTALEAIVSPQPATQPTTAPTTLPATPAREMAEALGLVRGGTIESKLIRTAPKGEIGVNVIGDNVTLRNLAFTDNGGYLVQVNNANTVIDGLEAGSFRDYALYVQGAKNTTVRRMVVVGGSNNESILRLDNVDGFTIEDSTLDYRPVTKRKAVARGFGKGIIFNRVTMYGGSAGTPAVFGLTPMTGFDAGEAYIAGGMLRVSSSPWIVTVDNRPEWEATIRQVVTAGVVDAADILRETLKRVPVKVGGKTIDPAKVDIALTASERVRYLAQRAESTITACTFIDLPIRNSAGGTQRYIDCTISCGPGVEPFSGWNEPTYPNPGFLLPQDVKRPAPVTTFERCSFTVASWSRSQFETFCRANNITLIACTFNGVAVSSSTGNVGGVQ